jgi:hypothetical protein
MTTVRFSQLVAAAGRPEVYLLFAKDDPEFDKALKQDRIMTVVERGSSPPFGIVGHEPGPHGQLLLFPKSLKPFAEMRAVGIKFELFSEPAAAPAAQPQRVTPAAVARPKPKPEKKAKAPPVPPPRPEKPAARKVIAFPRAEPSAEEGRVGKLKEEARRALQALERGETKAASRHLLRLLKA